ncbi:hypothetical protein JCM16303_002799 [Sporobolomyces ruberrimus]
MDAVTRGAEKGGSTAWLETLHGLLDTSTDVDSLYWRVDHSFAIRASPEIEYPELRRLGIVRTETLIHKLEEYGFQRLSEDKLFEEERGSYHVLIWFIIDHEEGSIDPQTTPITGRIQQNAQLEASTSRSAIRRRLEEHRKSSISTLEGLGIVPLVHPLVTFYPVSSHASSSQGYRESLYDSLTSTSPPSQTPALSRSTSSDRSLSPFPLGSSQSSPWTPSSNDLDISTFPSLHLLDDPAHAPEATSTPLVRYPWSIAPEPLPSFPQWSGGSLSSNPSSSFFGRLQVPQDNLASSRALCGSHGSYREPAEHSNFPNLPNYRPTDVAGDCFTYGPHAPHSPGSSRHPQNPFRTLESPGLPFHLRATGPNALPRRPPSSGGSSRRSTPMVPDNGGRMTRSKTRSSGSSKPSRSLLRPQALRPSPLHPHPYQSSSRTIHSKRDHLDKSSVDRLELLAASTSPDSGLTLGQSQRSNLPSLEVRGQRLETPLVASTRRSPNASLERILNPPPFEALPPASWPLPLPLQAVCSANVSRKPLFNADLDKEFRNPF